ncbi:MAG: filamentous hemagglutinin N-terminal domain-containing protein, partial [Verrucomicrobiota bacterium]
MHYAHKPIRVISLFRPHRTQFSFLRALFSTVMGVLVVFTGFPPHLLAASIQRGGAGAVSSSQGGVVSGGGSTVAAPVAARAQDVLTRTSQAIQAVKAMQSAARSAAAAANNLGADPNHPGQILPNVPNGLVTGGLVPDSGLAANGVANAVTSWRNAKTPVQTDNNGKTMVTIQQTGQQAILNWQTFNIGKDTTLNFDQSLGGVNKNQWIAFNKINDPTGVPSQILGSMTAQGQVYLINANGIVFGGASQINLHTLVASSLPINDSLVSNGLLNNPTGQFLFAAVPNVEYGDITVQAGANLISPTTADHIGGRIVLIGPNVTNAGTISTADGQTILAAGDEIGFAAHSSSDPSLRGLDVYIGGVDSTSGVVTNSGLIDAPRANITMAGKAVNQNGAIDSSTSVVFNGRVDLLADYNAIFNPAYDPVNAPKNPLFIYQSTGTVKFGVGSVTQILPEIASLDTVIGTQLGLFSQINVQGNAIYFGKDSVVWAPSANVTLSAGSWNLTGNGPSVSDIFYYTAGQIYLDSNATIDVAGSQDVSASVAENIISVQLNGAELANSPLQRTGVLRGKTVQVDIRQNGIYNGQAWVGTPVANTSGYVGLIKRSVGELTTSGGSITMNAGESVVMQPGSRIDVSGGWTNFQGGNVQTTRVISNGHSYDISQAVPDRIYDGISTSESHYEAG